MHLGPKLPPSPPPPPQSNIGRYTTGIWTRRYLEEQLLVALAGRAAEEVGQGGGA